MANCFVFSLLSAFVSIVVISHIMHNFSRTKIDFDSLSVLHREAERGEMHMVMSDRLDRVFWFMQITDIHLSVFKEPSRATDFQTFCSESVAVVLPDLILASGDLTDGKTENTFGSRQYVEEWNTYSRILRDSNVLTITQWLDIRGNHDAFNVPNIKHKENRFRVFGVQGPQHPQSYSFTLNKPFGNYSFIGLDACPMPGLKRPLNFFGVVNQNAQESIRRLTEQTKRSNHTFWFGHYPTSTIISPGLDLRETIGKSGFAYFCGHLHTFLNLVPRMYTVQPQGFLELELGDWRDNRYYRVVAVDHDLVSFVDVQMTDQVRQWPIVLITNPKNAHFLLPHKEPMSRIFRSTHIRILAWSKWPIDFVSVHIDNTHFGNAVPAKPDSVSQPSVSHTPLYVLPWNASKFSTGTLHTIKVHVRDIHGNERVVTQPFVTNGDPLWEYGFLPGFFLRADHGWNLCLCFYLFWFSLFATFLLARCLSTKHNYSLRDRSCLIRGLIRLSQTNQLLSPILVYLVYVITCPIFMAFLLDDHFGVVFVFGIFVDGTYIQEALTYLQEIIQLVLVTALLLLPTIFYVGFYQPVQKPVVVISSETADTVPQVGRTTCRQSTLGSLKSLFCSVPVILSFFSSVFTCVQLLFARQTIGIPYGWTAIVLGPGRWGPILLSWLLTYRCHGASSAQPTKDNHI